MRHVHRIIAGAALPLALGAASVVDARIVRMEFDAARSGPAFGGQAFGTTGAYQILRGTAYGELDPADPRNAVIVDLDLAARNAAGKVEYSTDVFVLKPVNLALGNHRVLLDYNNRGEMRLGRLNDVELTNTPVAAANAGNGWVMKQGYTVVGNGWDPGATGTDSMKIAVPAVPVALNITGRSYEYIVSDTSPGALTAAITYPAATPDNATLTVRAHLDHVPMTVAAGGWEYSNAARTQIRLLPLGTRFQTSYIYELTYTAKNPIVAGVGLAASRDVLSYLRHSTNADNPLRGDVVHTFSYSISQPSRTLNDHQELGFNEDENGKRVIDGILSWTGGGSGVAINYRFAQPGRTERNRQNHLYPEGVFPFAHQTLTDTITGRTGGRNARCTQSNTCPLRFDGNSANEYWVKAGSLLHTDTEGRDLKDPDNVRFYLVSGLSHSVGDVTTRSTCQQFLNPTSPYAAHRAMLVALDQWVSNGTEPPKSVVPRHADNTARAMARAGFQTGTVPQDELGWPNIPGVTYNGLITTRYALDFGPGFADGILTNYPPSVVGRPSYPIVVSAVDRDGNEIAGVRLPAVEAPIATTTGWGLRRAGFGENEGCEANGQHIPFAVTKAARIAAGDPRASLEERYKDHDGYVKAVAKAADKLVKERFLLPADGQAYVDEAAASNVLR